jgi:hypothetical protein
MQTEVLSSLPASFPQVECERRTPETFTLSPCAPHVWHLAYVAQKALEWQDVRFSERE